MLALLLAAAFRRPLPIIAGILLATLANHALAGALGQWLAHAIGPESMRWVLGVSFVAMGAWCLIPDRLEGERRRHGGLGAFGTTLIAFFLVEIGDKTQIATVALAARFESFVAVVLGTTLGMMIANVPVVYLGNLGAGRLPLRAIRIVTATIFALMGAAVLAGISIGI